MANQVNVSTTTNTVTITPQDTTNVSVGATNTSVNITQGSTSVVQVQTPGVKGDVGPTGPEGPQGPAQDTGSLLVNASYSNPNLTLTRGNGSTFNVGISTTTPTLDQVLNQGSSSNVSNIVLQATQPLNLTNLGLINSDIVLTYAGTGSGLVGKRDIDGRVFDDVLIDRVEGSGTGNLAIFIESQSLKSAGFVSTTGSSLIIGTRPELGRTFINNLSITSSIISASGTGSFGYMNLPNLPTSDPNEAGALFTTQSTGTGGNLEGQLVLLVSQG